MAVWAMTTLVAGPSFAAVDLRVEARATSNAISVFANVTNAQGAAVQGLTAADFAVLINGAVVTPTGVTPISGPVSVVFAMDYSDSVQRTALTPMRDAVNAYIAAMQPGDKAAIVKFNFANANKASVVQAFTDDKAALNAAVQAPYPDPGNGTNIFDALILSVQQFAPPTQLAPGPKAVILVSDGGDNASTANINQVITTANQAGIPIFTVNISAFNNGSDANTLRALAAETNATYSFAPTASQVAAAYAALETRISNEYLLTFPANTVPLACGTQFSLQVNVTGQATGGSSTFDRCVAVFVPNLLRLTRSEAMTAISTWNSTYTPQSGYTLTYGTETQQSSRSVPVGSVVSQTPPVATEVTANTAINAAISTGPGPATVPNVVGLTQTAATTAITGAQLVLGTVTQQSSTTVATGSVISQSPAAGASGVLEGATVTLVVSSGPPPASGGGGGGATGPFEILAGLLLLALARLRRPATSRGVANL